MERLIIGGIAFISIIITEIILYCRLVIVSKREKTIHPPSPLSQSDTFHQTDLPSPAPV